MFKKGIKISTYKGYDSYRIPLLINHFLETYEADSIGNITLYFDLYKDGKKLDIKESYTIEKNEDS